MRTRRRAAARAAVLAVTLGITACAVPPAPASSGVATPLTSPAVAIPSDPMIDDCIPEGEGTRFALPVGGRTISGVMLGDAPRAVVLSNQSDGSMCGWLSEARHLVARGYRAVLWDQDAVEWPDAIAAVVADQRTRGARAVVLMGASKGGWASSLAAGTIRPPVDGLVSLSGEGSLRGRTVYAELARFHGPVLVVSAEHDGLASDTLTTFPKVHGVSSTTVLALSGFDHGWALLDDEHASAVGEAIDRFLARAAPAAGTG